jgi:hypothetical protein
MNMLLKIFLNGVTMVKTKKYNKIKYLKKKSRELFPLKTTSIIRNYKHFLIEDAIKLAEEEELEEWKKE